jgi:hypothetical protein
VVRLLLAGEVPGLGVVVEGVIEAIKAFQATRNIRKMRKNSWFPSLIDLKNAENAIFYLKVLNRYTPKTFLRNTLIF